MSLHPAPATRSDVLIYVQHLLGIGHLRRAAVIARALASAGLKTDLVTGGPPVPGLEVGAARVHQLAPIRSRDARFTGLVDAEGRELDEAFKAARRDRLLALYETLGPRVLITELFPFGRRQLRFELLPLIDAARRQPRRPWILSSVRDILNEATRPEKTAWILETLKSRFDQVLVHGDPALVRLEESFGPAAEVAGKLRYTGYVVDSTPQPAEGPGEGEVLVSAGGGAVAAPLLEAALEAQALSGLRGRTWRLLVGRNLPEAAFRELVAKAPANVVVEPARPDFVARLARARLSISQAGYNTVIELVQAGVPGIVVPFAGDGETEQRMRARVFRDRGLLTMVEPEALSGATLAAAIDRIAEPGNVVDPPDRAIALDGAARTAEIVSGLAAEPPGKET